MAQKIFKFDLRIVSDDTLISVILPCKTCSSRLKNRSNCNSAAANIWRYREQTDRYRAIRIFQTFEHKKHGFKYFHDSYYFHSFQQADGFLKDVMDIDAKYVDCENRDLYARKRDIITQTYGMQKSVHFIYPCYPLKQSELDHFSKYDKSVIRKSTNLNMDLATMNSEIKYPLSGDSHLRFRPIKRVRTDNYFVTDYIWYYQHWKNWNPFKYKISEPVIEKAQTGSIAGQDKGNFSLYDSAFLCIYSKVSKTYQRFHFKQWTSKVQSTRINWKKIYEQISNR